jgi:alpha-N-arabinofuranosidase
VYGELGTRYFLKDALGIAAGLNEMIRNSDIYAMANYAQTVNVIGAIKTSKTDAEFAATGLALKLYRDHFGSIPVKVEVPQPLDAVAAWRVERRGKSLTLAVVNPVARAVTIDLNLEGAKLRGSARRWVLTGEDAMAFNEPGQPRRVGITASRMRGSFKKLTVAPLSVSLFEFPVSECKSTK